MNYGAMVLLLLFALSFSAQRKDAVEKVRLEDEFQEGCCVNRSFPRPKNVSQKAIPKRRLLEALNCATNNRFIGGTPELAKALRGGDSLHVSYYYGKFMPEQGGAALTLAVYSEDGNHGILFDMDWEKNNYFVANLPPLLRAKKQWRVGEINGGLWSYTRLWYLAQEIGTRPRQHLAVREVKKARPNECNVFGEDATAWTSGKGEYVGDSVRQANVKNKK